MMSRASLVGSRRGVIPRICAYGLAAALSCAIAFAQPPGQKKYEGQRAPLFEGMGDRSFPITTKSKLAQRFFDQGLMLAYGFNHKEAERSFREGTRLDPECAMCYWGAALVLGPNINAAMVPADVPKAYEAVQQAVRLAERVTERERALIFTLAKRYGPEPHQGLRAGNHPLDQAYAEAMRRVAKGFPDDPDVLVLAAEALMDLHPWDYYTREGEPKAWTPEIVSLLESALACEPDHPMANHLYIHAVEASSTPERGLPSADRLRFLVPGAGHLVHMPAHIYIRTGRYHEGSLANERALASDNEYITQCHQQGIYPLAYMPHNAHFLWATASLEGNSRRALEAARLTAEMTDKKLMHEPEMQTLQHYYSIPLYAMVRFGKWDDILREPKPAVDLIYPTGVWHYARGMAFARTGRTADAAKELAALEKIAADPALKGFTIWDINSADRLMRIASGSLAGELAAAKGEYAEAVEHLERAAAIEEELSYTEPPDWFFPVRHSLGAVLIEAGRHREAEQVYRDDLKKYPENGWSLWGLTKSLEELGRNDEAAEARKRFEKAWAWADVELASSRF